MRFHGNFQAYNGINVGSIIGKRFQPPSDNIGTCVRMCECVGRAGSGEGD